MGETEPGRNPGEVESAEAEIAPANNVEEGASMKDLAPGAPVGAVKSKGDLRALARARVPNTGITGERNSLQTSNFLQPKPKAPFSGRAKQARPESSGGFKKREMSPSEKNRVKELYKAKTTIRKLVDKFDIDYDTELKLDHSSREREFVLDIKINNNLGVPLKFLLEGFMNKILLDLDVRMTKEGYKKKESK